MAQKTGALIFDEQTDRYDIRFDLADYCIAASAWKYLRAANGSRPVSSTAKTGIW